MSGDQGGPRQSGGGGSSAPPQSGGHGGPQQSGGRGGDRSAVDRAAEITDYEVDEWLSLDPGEEIQWVGEPTKLRMVGTIVTGIVTIPLLVGIFVLLASPYSYLVIKHTDYVVTNRSLYVKKGILTTNIETADLDRIQNTEFTQSFWGKQLGFGTIEVSTAGSGGADISFDDIEDAREVRDEIARVQREFAGGDRGARDGTGGRSAAAGAGAASADQLEELLTELRATREALQRVADTLDEGADGGDAGGSTRGGHSPDDPSVQSDGGGSGPDRRDGPGR